MELLIPFIAAHWMEMTLAAFAICHGLAYGARMAAEAYKDYAYQTADPLDDARAIAILQGTDRVVNFLERVADWLPTMRIGAGGRR